MQFFVNSFRQEWGSKSGQLDEFNQCPLRVKSGYLRFYSIVGSAHADGSSGTSTPICFAVFRLMMNSNLVDCSTAGANIVRAGCKYTRDLCGLPHQNHADEDENKSDNSKRRQMFSQNKDSSQGNNDKDEGEQRLYHAKFKLS